MFVLYVNSTVNEEKTKELRGQNKTTWLLKIYISHTNMFS